MKNYLGTEYYSNLEQEINNNYSIGKVQVKSQFDNPLRKSLEKMFDGTENQYTIPSNIKKLEQQLKDTPFEIKNYQDLVRRVQGRKDFIKIEDYKDNGMIYHLALDNLDLIVSCHQDAMRIKIEGTKKLEFELTHEGKVMLTRGNTFNAYGIFESFKPFLLEVGRDSISLSKTYKALSLPMYMPLLIPKQETQRTRAFHALLPNQFFQSAAMH